ncbi:MAG TPA: Rieske 2Fe-2S domain-containing protein [Polyangiaceae bacterium]
MAERPRENRNLFPGYPKGWFVIAFAEELPAFGILPANYFGRNLVLFRGEDGAPRLLDTYCAHLGASLAAGGKVVGNSIECPFHAWRYGGDGKCVEIPYAKKIPKKACVESWTVREQNGLIYMWHHPNPAHRMEPEFDIPVLEEWGKDGWTRWTMSKLPIKTHPREIVENVVDKAHFPKVHNTHVDMFENEFDGPNATQRTRGVAYPLGGGKDEFEITATYFGPGYQLSWMKGVLEARLLNAHTPVDLENLDLRFGVLLKFVGNEEKTKKFATMYAENLRLGFHQDIQIWENKKYREVPVLCDGDGPIIKLRQWYSQFYGQGDGKTTLPVATAADEAE